MGVFGNGAIGRRRPGVAGGTALVVVGPDPIRASCGWSHGGRATAVPLTLCCRLVVCTRSSRSRLQGVSPTGGDLVAERLKENRGRHQARAGHRAPVARDERNAGMRTHVVTRLVIG